MRLALLFLLVALTANAQEIFHVKSQHRATHDEELVFRDSAFFHSTIVTGTLNGKLYTIEALDAGWTKLEVGKDFPATLKGNDVIIETQYKNKPNKTKWHIVAVSEEQP